MKVLFLSAVVPWPPDSGGRIRTATLLEELGRRHEIELHCVVQPEVDVGSLDPLLARVARLVLHERARPNLLARLVLPKAATWFFSRTTGHEVRRRIEAGDVDLLHVDEPMVTPQLIDPGDVPRVLHHHKLDSRVATELQRVGLRHVGHDAARTLSLERRAARAFPRQVACCEEDAAMLRARYSWVTCDVVENGVDVERFTPDPATARDPDELLFLGTLDYGPNVDALGWLASEILPRVRASRPAARLLVVGRDPALQVRDLEGDGLHVLGPVADVRPYLRRAAALVAPLRAGGGTRLKLVEALACECPVVATPLAAEGLTLVDGLHLDLAEDAPGLAERILAALADPRAAASRARAGRAVTLERYAWPRLAARLGEVWEAARAAS